MDSSPLDWGYHLLPCSTTFNQAPLWSLPISSRPSLKLSASIRSCRQARQARLRSALVNYYRLVKPRCLSYQRGQEKWTHFYVQALTYLRNHGRAGRLGETVVDPALWCCRRWVLFSNPNPKQWAGIEYFQWICDVGVIHDPPNQPQQQKNPTPPDSFSCCSAEVRWCAPADLCLHLCPYRINKAIFVCSKVKYTNLRCWRGTFSHLLLMFRPVESVMSILSSRVISDIAGRLYHYFSVAVGVFLQQTSCVLGNHPSGKTAMKLKE